MRRRSSRTDKCHALFDVLILPLAGNGDRVVADFDGDIIRVHAAQVGTDDELVSPLEEVDLRHPGGHVAIRPASLRHHPATVAARLSEQATDVIAEEALEQRERPHEAGGQVRARQTVVLTRLALAPAGISLRLSVLTGLILLPALALFE